MSSAIKAILTDIEGTTTSISFVHEKLFPYSRKALPQFIQTHWDDPQVHTLLMDTAKVAGISEVTKENIIQTLVAWIDEDRKETPLKSLQGLIWAHGYETGELKGHLYHDANELLCQWSKRGLTIAVFSSGSVQAQKLLFRYSMFGDLTPLFSGHFDTTIASSLTITNGAKRVRESYDVIAQKLSIPSEEILFLSDVAEELDAAHESGMLTVQLVRPEDGTVPTDRHPVAKDFNEVEQKFFEEERSREQQASMK